MAPLTSLGIEMADEMRQFAERFKLVFLATFAARYPIPEAEIDE